MSAGMKSGLKCSLSIQGCLIFGFAAVAPALAVADRDGANPRLAEFPTAFETLEPRMANISDLIDRSVEATERFADETSQVPRSAGRHAKRTEMVRAEVDTFLSSVKAA